MRWIKIIAHLVMVTVIVLNEAAAQQPIRVTNVRYEKFLRFSRFDISVTDRPDYSFVDDLEHGIVSLELDGRIPETMALPVIDSGEIMTSQDGENSIFQIKFPTKFRYESFYYPPEKKIIIDVYLSKEPIAKPVSNPVAKPVVPRKIPVKTGSSYLSGLTALQDGDTTKAIAYFNETLNENPNHTRAHLQLGMLLATRMEKEQALVHLKKTQKNVEFAFISNLYISKLNETDVTKTQQMLPASTEVSQPVESQNTASLKPEQRDTSGSGENSILSQFANTFVMKSILLAVASVVALITLYSVWRNWKYRARNKNKREDQVQRIIKLMEKNNFYRSAKPGVEKEPEDKSESPKNTRLMNNEQVDLRDADEPFVPKPDEIKTRIPLAEGYPPSERRIESSRLRQIQRTMNENNIVPESRNRLTPTALKVKSEILDYALDGYSVREIAEKLQIGVGEVELVLGLRKSEPATENSTESNLRIDFADR